MKTGAPNPATPRTRPPRSIGKVRRKDQDFLPAALEILEKPPSPVGLALLLIICALVFSALVWAYIGRVDVIAIAEGKTQPTGKVKVVQPLETGKVQSIEVNNGSRVKTGQVVLELDSAEQKARVNSTETTLASYKAEITRRRAAVALARSVDLQDIKSLSPSSAAWKEGVPTSISERENEVLEGDIANLLSDLSTINGQILQKEAEQKHLTLAMTAQQELIATLRDRLSIRESLIASRVGSKVDWLDTMERVKAEQVALATKTGQLVDAQVGVEVLQRNLGKTISAFIAENLQKLASAQRQADELTEKLIEAQAQLQNTTLRSPIDGTVLDLSVTSVGQVVATGVEVMRIVPTGSILDVEAYLPNADIGFVRVGQPVDVKIEAFPFTRYGTVSGIVSQIGNDSILQQEAQQSQIDPANSARLGRTTTGKADVTHGLVFPLLITLATEYIDADGRRVHLSPGMSVTVEIKTGKRRILEYLLSPLVEVASQSLRER